MICVEIDLVKSGKIDLNHLANGMEVIGKVKPGEFFHAKHPAYTDFISKKINDWVEANDGSTVGLEKYIRESLASELKDKINKMMDDWIANPGKSGDFKLNTIK